MPIELTNWKREYNTKKSEAEQAVAEALCLAYREVTGKAPSDRLVSALEDAIHMELL
jgi:hypothetical protein